MPISLYIRLTSDELKAVDNIDLCNLTNTVKSFPYTDISGAQTNLFVLELLKYFDSQKRPDSRVLNVAEDLAKYLIENDKGNVDSHKINLLQITKRRRGLNPEEIDYLMNLKRESLPEFQLACSILLESFHEAEYIFERLDEQQKANFKQYPIFALWKHAPS